MAVESRYVVESDQEPSGVYFAPSIYESFLHTSLALAFHNHTSATACSSFRDCRTMTNGYCVQGQCLSAYAYYHNAMDPGVQRGARMVC